MKDNIDKLITTIKNEKVYQDYLIISDEIKKNEKLQKLITEVKTLQKKVVKEENLGLDKNNFDILEKEYKQKLDELNEMPLYIEYRNKIDELNEIFLFIEQTLNNELLK